MNWEQLKTVLWLRWRLICNQSARSHGLGMVLGILIGAGAVYLLESEQRSNAAEIVR